MKSFKEIFSIGFILIGVFIYACKKDKNPPTINLVGEDVLEIRFDTTFKDPGAMANDEEDGNISGKIASNWNNVVDLKKLGTYIVTYSVEDKNSNKVSINRKVIVKLKASNFFGEYHSNYTLDGYPDSGNFTSIISHGSKQNEFTIQPFGHPQLLIPINVAGTLGTQLSINYQIGDYFIEGTGSTENNGKNISINYRIVYQNSHVSTGTETLVKK